MPSATDALFLAGICVGLALTLGRIAVDLGAMIARHRIPHERVGSQTLRLIRPRRPRVARTVTPQESLLVWPESRTHRR